MSENAHSQFLGYLHSFRGFAIINIVMLHAVVAAVLPGNNFELDMSDPLTMISHVVFGGSTLYFSVISGLLFTAILKSRGYVKFYRNKVRNVIFPYIFFTALLSVFVFMDPMYAIQPDFISYLKAVGLNLLYGKADVPYWYIPVLIFIYLLTPLAMKLLEVGKMGKVLFVLITILPLIISRGGDEFLFTYAFSFKSVVYFFSGYMVGMLIGDDLKQGIAWLKKNMIPISIAAVLSTLALFYMFIQEIDPKGFISIRQSLFYINKISMSCIMIVAFQSLGERQPKWLHGIAEDAFAIYFMHSFFLFFFLDYFTPLLLWEAILPLNEIVGFILLFIFSMILSRMLILLFRKMFGKRSKMIVGA